MLKKLRRWIARDIIDELYDKLRNEYFQAKEAYKATAQKAIDELVSERDRYRDELRELRSKRNHSIIGLAAATANTVSRGVPAGEVRFAYVRPMTSSRPPMSLRESDVRAEICEPMSIRIGVEFAASPDLNEMTIAAVILRDLAPVLAEEIFQAATGSGRFDRAVVPEMSLDRFLRAHAPDEWRKLCDEMMRFGSAT